MNNENATATSDLSSGKTIKAAKSAKPAKAAPKGNAKAAKAAKPAKAAPKGNAKAAKSIDYAARYSAQYAAVNDNDGQAKITILASTNPKREGSGAHKRFAMYKNGMTYNTAIEKGITRADISWDIAHKYIKLGK